MTTTPSWLTDTFLLSILRSTLNDPSIELSESCSLQPGTTAGDSFSGALYRAVIHYHSQNQTGLSTSWMVKTESSSALNTDRALFDTERRIYAEVLPAMQSALGKIGESISVPRLIHCGAGDERRVLIMEDLRASGWTRRDEIGSYEDALPALRTIAKFHASSFLLNKSGMILTDFSNSAGEKGALLNLFGPVFDRFVDAVCNWTEFTSIHATLRDFQVSMGDHLKRVYRSNPDPNGYNVLIHGDFHGKNLLHKLDSGGQIVDTAALDFQVCHWGSPAIDLVYFLYLIVARDVLDGYRDQLIGEYHRYFADCLKRMGFQGWIPGLEDLDAELRKNVFFEVFHDALGVQFRMVDFSKVSMEDFVAGRVENVGLKNEQYCASVRKNLNYLINRGILK